MALSPGARLGPYEVLSALGAGGMGKVYRARDTRLDRTVAIKVLPSEVAGDPDLRARFEREARAVAALDHPHICGIYDVGHVDGMHYLVMPHLEGQTLAARLEKGPLPLDQALKIATEIADALDKAHRQGIIHRDLKPANIILTKAGSKLLDFGLAKLRTTAGPISMSGMTRMATRPPETAQGTILGTVQYMAPEQVEGKEADARSDIWALGAVIYEMVTGTRPFQGDSPASVIGAILKDEPPPISSRQPLTPAMLDRVVARCLAKDANDRWQSATDLHQGLLWIADGFLAKVALTETGNAHSPQPARRGSALARSIPWAIVAMLTAALIILWSGGRSPEPQRPGVARFELNYPPGIEISTTNNPSLAISPDGSLLAFAGGAGGVREIYVRKLDQVAAARIRGTERIQICVFSPDGRSLAFVTSERILKKVSLADGLVTTVATDADYIGGGGTWGPDDRITFSRGGTLWQVPASGGEARQLTTLDAGRNERLHGWPNVVDGGKAVLFTIVTGGDRIGTHIEAVSVATGQRRVVIDAGNYPIYASSGHLIFFRNGGLLAAPFDPNTLETTGPAVAVLDDISLDQLGNPIMAVSAAGLFAYVPSANATKRLVWVSREGVEQPITETSRPYQNPRLASDGHRIVVEVAGGDLWMQDVVRETFTRLTSGETFGNTFAVWMPNASRILFRTLTGIHWINPDGSGGSHEISGTSVNDIPTSISPDGQTLAFVRQTSATSGDIYVMPLEGNSAPSVIVKTIAYDGGGMFSPDGRLIAYVSSESGEFQVYMRLFGGPDRKVQVSTEGGTHPRWNPNGKELFYRSGNKMMVVDVSMGSDLKPSRPRVLFEQRYAFGSAQTIPNYDVSPDGRRFVMVKDDSASGRLNIVLNWLEELKRLAPTGAR